MIIGIGGAVDVAAFGRYQLLDVVGEGGMGRVYRAHDPMMNREVAIKLLRKDVAADPDYRERFRREALAAAGLTHPHVIPIHDFGDANGQLFLVMPFVDGTTLDEVLRHHGPMPPQRAVVTVEQLAGALSASHAKGLIHRDVKPSNALVTTNFFTYLIDFGIAHDAAATKLTRTGGVMGSMAYMAPERFIHGTADVRADVYSLTCVLHECLTGAQPFPGNSIEQQVAAHLSAEPPRPSALRAGVPTGLDDVIVKGMAKNPEERFQTAYELATAARDALTPGRVVVYEFHGDHAPTKNSDPTPAPQPAPAAPAVQPFAPRQHAHVIVTLPAQPPEDAAPDVAAPKPRIPKTVAALFVLAGVLGGIAFASGRIDLPRPFGWLDGVAWGVLAVALLLLARSARRSGFAAVRFLAAAAAAVAALTVVNEVVWDAMGPSLGGGALDYLEKSYSALLAVFGVLTGAVAVSLLLRRYRAGFAVALFAIVPAALLISVLTWIREGWSGWPWLALELLFILAGVLGLRGRRTSDA